MSDPRTDRSRRRLHDALVALILERGWDRVTVRGVCDRARVGRSTFYLHFADKEDCLVGGLEHVRDELRRGRRDRRFAFVRGLVSHAGASRRLFRAVIGKRSGLAVQRRFRAIVLELVRDEVRDVVTARFLTGALVELMFGWIDGEPIDVERDFMRLATRVVPAHHPA